MSINWQLWLGILSKIWSEKVNNKFKFSHFINIYSEGSWREEEFADSVSQVEGKDGEKCGDIEGKEGDGGEGDGEVELEGEVREDKGLFLTTNRNTD